MGENIEDKTDLVSFNAEEDAEVEDEVKDERDVINEKPIQPKIQPQLTEEQRQSLLGSRKFYYNRVFCILELVKCCQHKEMAFLSAKGETNKLKYRQLLVETYDLWKMITEKIGFQDKLVNVYNSCAIFQDGVIPMSSLNPIRRADSLEYQEFNDNAISKMKGYSFLIDVDGENFVDAYNQAKQVKEIFDEFKLGYYMLNSSSKGFHFVVEDEYTDPSIKLLDRCAVFGTIAKNIQAIYSDLEGIDTTIYDFRRIKKVPYSMSCMDRTVCLPLDDTEFNEKLKVHQEKYLLSYNVLARIMIKNRGLLTRNLELGEEQLQKNFGKFVEEFK